VPFASMRVLEPGESLEYEILGILVRSPHDGLVASPVPNVHL